MTKPYNLYIKCQCNFESYNRRKTLLQQIYVNNQGNEKYIIYIMQSQQLTNLKPPYLT